MKLSVAMIVKNEEKYIENTLKPLKRLQNYIDSEIVIVDTGSTDNTVKIAKKYTDKIYYHEWNNDFAYMRNISINYCVGDWILIVDADEVLYDIEELANLVKSEEIYKYNSLFVKIINFIKSTENSIDNGIISSLIRLFKKDTVNYKGIVHEQPIYKDPITDTNIRFIHYGYDNDDYELMEYKFKRNLGLLFKQLKNEPNNIYTNFQIANSYTMHKDLVEALKYIEIAYKNAKSSIGNYIYVIDKYCLILYSIKDYKSLINKAKQGIMYFDDFIDFYFYLGEAYNNLNRYDEATVAYEKYLQLHKKLEKDTRISNKSVSIVTRGNKDIVLHNLVICFYKNKFYEKALDLIQSIGDKDFLRDRALVVFKVLVEGRCWDKIDILNGLVDKYNYENILLFFHKEVLLEDLQILSKRNIEGNLKRIIDIVKYYKQNENIDDNYLDTIKKEISKNKISYTIYVYYVLKYNINEINFFVNYGKDKLENILVYLSSTFYDFNEILMNGLENFQGYTTYHRTIRIIIEKALLLSGKLSQDKKKNLFLHYIADRYYCILKTYNNDVIYDDIWLLSSEDRFILELKNNLSYKYEDTLKYIKSMKSILNLEKSYIDYMKLLTEGKEENVNSEIKALIPELRKNIETLIDVQRYQEAYDTIEQALKLIKFDYDIMVLKLELLIKFNYTEEAAECLKKIILYGPIEKVNELIQESF